MKQETKKAQAGADEGGMVTLSPSASRPARTLMSAEIFADAQEVIIEHAGDYYRLRSTRKGKLILTK